MKEIAEDKSLFATGTMVEVDHPTRGKYLSVGNPIKLSASPSEVKRSPLLGRAHRGGAGASSATRPTRSRPRGSRRDGAAEESGGGVDPHLRVGCPPRGRMRT